MTASEKNGCSPAVAAPVDPDRAPTPAMPVAGSWRFKQDQLHLLVVDADDFLIFDQFRWAHTSGDMTIEDALTCVNFPPGEREKNAAMNAKQVACFKLTVAAPDLLAALKVARDHVRFFCEEVDDEGSEDCKRDLALVDAAIAKAESR